MMRTGCFWASLIERERVTMWNTGPQMMQMLAEHARGELDTEASRRALQ